MDPLSVLFFILQILTGVCFLISIILSIVAMFKISGGNGRYHGVALAIITLIISFAMGSAMGIAAILLLHGR